MHYSTATVYVD